MSNSMTNRQSDYDILRALATRQAEIASLPVQKETLRNWKRINALDPIKPMVSVDQICWEEFQGDEALQLKCADPFLRKLEWNLRATLYRWAHFPCDLVVPAHVDIPMAIGNSGYGIDIVMEDTVGGELHRNSETHLFADQIADEDALARIVCPVITHDVRKSAEHKALAEEALGGILDVRMAGVTPVFRVWDEITFFRGVTPILYDFADRPEFLHAIMEKFTNIHLNLLDQYEALNVLDTGAPFSHCSPTHTDLLPTEDYDPERVLGRDCWASGMAQIFSSCSPAQFDEFEIAYAKRYYARCGLVNYGCCEPLHDKVHLIRQMHGIRKVSCSPWADVRVMAEQLGSDYVLLRKPNPSFLSGDALDEASIRRETRETLAACRVNGTPCEFILKDITTVMRQPERLDRWAQIVKEEIADFAG